MEDNNELVTDVTENVEEQATEELVNGAKVEEPGEQAEPVINDEEAPVSTEQVEKTYTKAELTEKIDNAVRRREAKLRREYEDKYSKIETVLNAGLGTSNIQEATNKLEDFYKQKGINIPSEPRLTERQVEVLGKNEANEIISAGFDEVVEEVDRLAEKGIENMTPYEKIVFKNLAEYRQTTERENELAKIGVNKDVLTSSDFQEFASQFKDNVPVSKVYEQWQKNQPKPKVEQIGSMKTMQPDRYKDYYTPEEVDKLTMEDLNNPKIMEAVDKSMAIWYSKK